MELVKSIIILVIGFALLMKGADYFVEGSSSVAKRLYIPSMIIGMTIVAMGTSLPECAVSVTASLAGNNTLAVSNVVGSNIFNLMVVCGACALFAPLTIKKRYACKRISIIDYLFSFVDRTGICGNEVGTYRWNGLFNSFRRLSCLDDQFRKESKSSAQRGRADERIRRVCRR